MPLESLSILDPTRGSLFTLLNGIADNCPNLVSLHLVLPSVCPAPSFTPLSKLQKLTSLSLQRKGELAPKTLSVIAQSASSSLVSLCLDLPVSATGIAALTDKTDPKNKLLKSLQLLGLK